ncbi:hypothetical protein [Pseudomonas versuta]|uniref:hypothetical protein n=1 Tax=Pseudomonas versuta TaxID=1788301 RepID=UPI000F7AA16B|nr:hypothetical protein [Pseudomonas versuta]
MKSQRVKALLLAGVLCAFGTPAFAIGSGDATTNSGSPAPNANGEDSALTPGNMPSAPKDGNGADAERATPAPGSGNSDKMDKGSTNDTHGTDDQKGHDSIGSGNSGSKSSTE